MNTSTSPLTPATLKSPFVVAGIALFFLNTLSEQYINLPVAEFGILGAIFYFIYQQEAIVKSQSMKLAFVLTICLGLWVGIVDYYHDYSAGGAIRSFLRTFTFYALIIGYVLLPRKEGVFHLVTGILIGHLCYFMFLTYTQFFINQQAMYQLKWLLPPPSIFILVVFFYREYFSRSIVYACSGFFLTFMMMSGHISSRGGFLSLVIGLLLYATVKYARIPAKSLAIPLLLLPFLFVAPLLYFYDAENIWQLYYWLHGIDYATNSNIERLFNLHTSIKIISENPWVGGGVTGLSQIVDHYIIEVVDGAKINQTPHNYYLELAVPYGLPAMFMAMGILYLIYTKLIKTALMENKHPAIAIFIITIISWSMLTNTGSGYARFIVFYLLIIGFYGMDKQRLSLKENN